MGTEVLASVHGERNEQTSLRSFQSSGTPVEGLDPRNLTVLDRLRAAVEQYPGREAISDETGSLTYSQLWNFAAAFRSRLVADGVRPGDMVGIAAQRSVATVAAIVGIGMAGGCYVPITPEQFPAAVFKQLVADHSLRHWIVDGKSRAGLDSDVWAGISVVPVESVVCPHEAEPVAISPVEIGPESPIYVMFTSGSTGVPKGVIVPHRAVARLVTGQSFLQFGPAETFLLHSPLSFDASTLELWGSLSSGARLVVAPAGHFGLDEMAGLIAEAGVTTLWLTAAMFHLAAEYSPEMFVPLTQLVFGGDVILPRHVERIRKLYPGLHMVNGYGPTENTTFTCCYEIPADYKANGPVPIGLPIAHTTVQIWNAADQPVAVGEEGELVTGGSGVALGYLGQPEITAHHFIADRTGGMLYRTGDRVRQREDGIFEFLGRLDSQVKIAGHRVELDAIERVLTTSPLVADAAVVVLSSESGEKQLAAGVALRSAAVDAQAQLRAWGRERLSSAAIPQHWIFLDHLPINANGKIDRAALRQHCELLLLPKTSSANPLPAFHEGRVADSLCELWAQLLHRPSVELDDSFFDLGGTSLLLIEMHARLKKNFPHAPSLVEMFAYATPRSLAERLIAERLVAGPENARPVNDAEQRGARQRAALLDRKASSAKKNSVPSTPMTAGKDGIR